MGLPGNTFITALDVSTVPGAIFASVAVVTGCALVGWAIHCLTRNQD